MEEVIWRFYMLNNDHQVFFFYIQKEFLELNCLMAAGEE